MEAATTVEFARAARALTNQARRRGLSYTTGENTLAVELVERLEPGMVLLADCRFCAPTTHAVESGRN